MCIGNSVQGLSGRALHVVPVLCWPPVLWTVPIARGPAHVLQAVQAPEQGPAHGTVGWDEAHTACRTPQDQSCVLALEWLEMD